MYALSGEGMGHTLRSRIIIEYLIKKGHTVDIFAGAKAYQFLSKYFKNITKTHSLYMVYRNNELMGVETFLRNFAHQKEWLETLAKIERYVNQKKPRVIISDFEPFSSIMAGRFNLPLISICHQSLLTTCRPKVGKKELFGASIAKFFSHLIMQNPDYFFVTSFYFPKRRPNHLKNAYLFPPLIRKEIRKQKPKFGKHILVYQTSKSNKAMFPILKKFKDQKFIVYGFDIDKKDGNLVFKKTNNDIYLKHLSNAKAVIMNGGYTLMCESLYLKKPVLSIPVKQSYEQILNARHLEKKGWGIYVENLTEKNLKDFLNKQTSIRRNLKKVKFGKNKDFFKKLENKIKKLSKKRYKKFGFLDIQHVLSALDLPFFEEELGWLKQKKEKKIKKKE